MKKLIILCVALSTFLAGCSCAKKEVPAVNEEIVKFSRLESIDGQVYGTPQAMNDGGFTFASGNTDVSELPKEITDTGTIYGFCYYEDRIYYLSGEAGSVSLPASIYSCNPDGTDNTMITDKALTDSEVYIYKNNIYFSRAFLAPDDYYTPLFICELNLGTGNIREIPGTDNANLKFIDRDYIYYYNYNDNKYYSTDYNGINSTVIDENNDILAHDKYVYNNVIHYISEGEIRSQLPDTEESSFITEVSDPDNCYIENIDNDYIYYVHMNDPKAEVFIVEN